MKQTNTNSYINKYKEQQEILNDIKELKDDERRFIQAYPALTEDQRAELEAVWDNINELTKQYLELQKEMTELFIAGVFTDQIDKIIELGII